MLFNPTKFAFGSYAPVPTLVLTKPRRNPAEMLVAALCYRPGRQAVFIGFLLLSFISITFHYLMAHNFLVSAVQYSTQLILLTLCLVLVAMGKVTFGRRSLAAFGAVFCVAVSQQIALFHSPAEEKNFFMGGTLPLFMMLGPIVRELSKRIPLAKRIEWTRKSINVLLAFFLFECVTRFIFSPLIRGRLNLDEVGVADLDTDGFYRFKFSIFFFDSNFTAVALLCLLALMLVHRRYVTSPQFALAYALLLATISRASMFAALCQILLFVFWRRRRWLLWAILLVAPPTILALFGLYLANDDSFTQLDRSFATKFFILERMVAVYRDADLLQKLFGVGLANTQFWIDIAAHNIIATGILEFGYAGSVLVLIYVALISWKSAPAFYLLVIPIVVNGFALIVPSFPCFYVTLGLLGALSMQTREVPAQQSPSMQEIK